MEPILNGSFTIGDVAIVFTATKIDDLDEGKWYEIKVNDGKGTLMTRVAIDFVNPETDPVGFVIEALEAARRNQAAVNS